MVKGPSLYCSIEALENAVGRFSLVAVQPLVERPETDRNRLRDGHLDALVIGLTASARLRLRANSFRVWFLRSTVTRA